MKQDKNIFSLYTGKLYDKLNKEATRDIKKAIKNGTLTVENVNESKLLDKFRNVGASDTASREAIVEYIESITR
jgi:hypothetical protein